MYRVRSISYLLSALMIRVYLPTYLWRGRCCCCLRPGLKTTPCSHVRYWIVVNEVRRKNLVLYYIGGGVKCIWRFQTHRSQFRSRCLGTSGRVGRGEVVCRCEFSLIHRFVSRSNSVYVCGAVWVLFWWMNEWRVVGPGAGCSGEW